MAARARAAAGGWARADSANVASGRRCCECADLDSLGRRLASLAASVRALGPIVSAPSLSSGGPGAGAKAEGESGQWPVAGALRPTAC